MNIWLFCMLVQGDSSTMAQEMDALDSSLILDAKELEVNFEYPVEEDLRFNIGDYCVVGKLEDHRIYSDTKVRLLGMRVVTDNTKSFSYHVVSSTLNTAMVITEYVNRVNAYFPNEVFENFFLSEITSEKFERFGAWITVNGDSTETWALYAKRSKYGKKRIPPAMVLTNGINSMELYTVSSDPHFDYARPQRSLREMPSMGIEFFENGVSLCTVQYSAGEANNFDLGPNQSFGCKVWMYQIVDPKTELIVSAAMSAILLLNNPYLTNLGD